jgi:hypothetical protein
MKRINTTQHHHSDVAVILLLPHYPTHCVLIFPVLLLVLTVFSIFPFLLFSLVPPFKWAENADKLFLTIEVQGCQNAKVDLSDDAVKFSGSQGDKNFELDFKLFKKVNVQASSWAAKAREIEILLQKADECKGWWNQLLADKNQYKGRCKIDWDLWHDEDESKEMPASFGGNPGGMDFARMMQGMGGAGMGGMGGMVSVGCVCFLFIVSSASDQILFLLCCLFCFRECREWEW